MESGDWGLGIGDWGLGIGGWGLGLELESRLKFYIQVLQIILSICLKNLT